MCAGYMCVYMKKICIFSLETGEPVLSGFNSCLCATELPRFTSCVHRGATFSLFVNINKVLAERLKTDSNKYFIALTL